MGRLPKPGHFGVALGLAVLASLALALPALAAGSGINPFPPEGVSPNGQAIRDLYNLVSVPALIIFVGVEIALLYAIVRYRKGRVGADYKPPQWHGNTPLEIVWTAIPLVVVLFIAALSFNTLQNDFTKRTDAQTDMDISVTGFQFGWTYDYKNENISVTSTGLSATPLVVPTHKLVRLQLQGRDVIHSFWVPEVMGKTDAVPGYSNFTWFKIDKPGEWRGECAELCGAGHSTMQIRIQAMEQADFDAWVAQQRQAQASPSASPSAARSPSASPSAGPSGSPSARPSGSPSGSPSASPSRSP